MSHLTQPNKQVSIYYEKEINRTLGSGERVKTLYPNIYTFEMEPVIKGGKAEWKNTLRDVKRFTYHQSINDEELTELMLFEAWCKKHAHESKTVNEWEAIHIFREDLPSICNDHIRAGDNIEDWRELLGKLRNQNHLKFKDQINRAKSVPIMSLINSEVRMNKINCIVHDDSSASLHIYSDTNRWWCFGCQSGGSTIDFIMALNKCTLKEAVKYLT